MGGDGICLAAEGIVGQGAVGVVILEDDEAVAAAAVTGGEAVDLDKLLKRHPRPERKGALNNIVGLVCKHLGWGGINNGWPYSILTNNQAYMRDTYLM